MLLGHVCGRMGSELYCDGFAQSIIRQQLGKHSRGNEYTTAGWPLLGSLAVTHLYNNSGNRRRCFLCGPCRFNITRMCLYLRLD
jgi:hypothetical protein